ncbi:hypothetical protein NIES2107_16000 [Nostoc carneum NIES-2107]|nr:hypothetical protein NIES2107_16000 [Nostoc carneum NIES-2107]
MWRFSTRYIKTNDIINPYQCYDTFTAYLEGYKSTPLRINFVTYEDPWFGGPLRCGETNLHRPKFACVFIKEALKYGWNPAKDCKPLIIEKGNEFFTKMGYQIK